MIVKIRIRILILVIMKNNWIVTTTNVVNKSIGEKIVLILVIFWIMSK